jgi:anthranilate phosphoribosyltransferase
VPLYWIVHELGGQRSIFVAEANSLIYARLQASRAGHAGKFIEAHELDRETARQLPSDLLGQTLNPAKARAILAKMRS